MTLYRSASQTARKSVAVIVAHPNDETLWAGGTLLDNPSWDTFICCLCRGKDSDQTSKFFRALKRLNAKGAIGDLDDSPEQPPLLESSICETILSQLPDQPFDAIFTHSPEGEYTGHLPHQEIGQAVINLWHNRSITTKELRVFAYQDGNRQYRPRAITADTLQTQLGRQIWSEKLAIITDIYGFERSSWEAQATPELEAIHRFGTPQEAADYFSLGTR